MKAATGLTMLLAMSACDSAPKAAPPPAATPRPVSAPGESMPASAPGGSMPASAPGGSMPASAPGESMMVTVPTNAWLGRWTGPEGLFLDIAADGGEFSGRYRIDNRYTLDARGTFTGLADRDTIVFKRAGREVRIRAGTGDQTGMKWLAGKANCLVLGPGEGYCRE